MKSEKGSAVQAVIIIIADGDGRTCFKWMRWVGLDVQCGDNNIIQEQTTNLTVSSVGGSEVAGLVG